MRFQLLSGADGPVLGMSVFLHATSEIACLWTSTGAFALNADQATVVDVVLDRADECATPLTMATMDVVLNGPVQIGSRQAWGSRYFFNP